MLLYDMGCKSVVCIVIFAIVHGQEFSPLTSLEESEIFHLPNNPAAVSVNPKAYNYFTGEVSSKSQLPQPNVYVMSLRHKRSQTLRDFNEPEVSEEEHSRRQDNRRFSRKKGASKRVHRSSEVAAQYLIQCNRKEESDTPSRPDKVRRNERNDHDRQRGGSRTHSNAENNSQPDRDRNHHNDHNHHSDHDHNHHNDHNQNNHHDHHRHRRDKPNSDNHSNSRHDRHGPQPSSPNDKKRIFTKNVIKSK